MIRLLNYKPEGKDIAFIGNRHGDTINNEISDFCGQEVTKALLDKLKHKPSGRVYFEKDGVNYRLYGGPSRAVTIPGKYCFHVYKYVLSK